MRNKYLKYSLIGLVVILVVFLAIVIFTPDKSVKVGTVTAVGGVCNGSEPTTQNCNVNDNYLTVQNNADVLGTLAVTGTTTLSGVNSFTGNVSASSIISTSLVQGGSATVGNISTSSATYTLSAANSCAYSTLNITPLGAALTFTLPATSTLFATCLTEVGQFSDKNVNIIGTSTVFAAGAGGTLASSSSATIAAGKSAILRILRDATLTYKAYLVNLN